MSGAPSSAKPATLRDVAARAGVSTATVSRALRSAVGTDPATRRRVQEAARALRYRPSGVARSLKLRATRTIGLIVTDIGNPYFPQIVRAVEDFAQARDYSVVLADGRGDPDREIQSLEILAERQVDGLLLASSALSERHRSWIKEGPCPVVILNGESPLDSVAAVLSDNKSGGRLATSHLLTLGHHRISYLATPEANSAALEERLAGVRATLADHGRLSTDLRVVPGAGGVEGGAAVARLALDDHPETTALICYNDLTAVGALRGCQSLGLRVPQDVSVVGFDDIELASYVDPPLTTVRQATEEIGRWAVDTLFEAIEGGPGRPASMGGAVSAPVQRIAVELVVRRSTGSAADR